MLAGDLPGPRIRSERRGAAGDHPAEREGLRHRPFPGPTPSGNPSAVAVECGDERLTYAQLEAWSDETARTLRAEAPPGLPVA
ncbi:hypothetical protein, partial [Streptomyces mirabilis]